MTTMTSDVLGLPRGRALVRGDLEAMPDDGHRYELIDGVLIVSPAPRVNHQRAIARLHLILHAVCPPHLEVLFAPLDVVLTEDTVIQPDLLVASRAAFTERELPGPPLVAIEVLSPSTRGIDLLLKKDRLRRAACAHYWVVDPDEPSITAWALRDGQFLLASTAIGDEELSLDDPFRLTLVPATLLS